MQQKTTAVVLLRQPFDTEQARRAIHLKVRDVPAAGLAAADLYPCGAVIGQVEAARPFDIEMGWRARAPAPIARRGLRWSLSLSLDKPRVPGPAHHRADPDQVSRRSLIDKLLRRYGISAVLTSESRIDSRAGVIVWLARTAPTRARKVRSRLLSWLARA